MNNRTTKNIFTRFAVMLLCGCIYCYAAEIHALDGDLAPRGAPDGQVNAADLLVMQRIVLGQITATPTELQDGDLYPPPPGSPDGVINTADLIRLYGLVLQTGQQISAPVAVDDPAAAITAEDTTVTTSNVLANDTLVDNAVISTFDVISANSTQVNVVANGGGTFDYTPPPDFNGTDSFTYTLIDDQGDTSTATVTITVTAVNDVPVANADAFIVASDALLSGNVLVDNGSGADSLGDEPTSVALGSINVTNGDLTLNADGTFSYIPNAGYGGTDAFSYTLTDNTPDTSAEATVTITVIPNQTVITNQLPAQPNTADGVSYELGMKFQSSAAGHIKAIRYFKSSLETGIHQGTIWSSAGVQLSSVTFTNETTTGWQEQALDTPLNIQPDTVYVVSVNANQYFAVTTDVLDTPITNGTLSSVVDGNNGVFGSLGTFPTSSYMDSNYFRDVAFSTGTIIVKAGGDNQNGEIDTTLSTPMVIEVRDANGLPEAGIPINFLVTAGNGSISTSSTVTDGNGQASTTLTLGAAGINTVSAIAMNIGSVTFTATATLPPEPPTQLDLTPESAKSNIFNPVVYHAQIQDQFGNTVTNASDQITFAVSGISGTFSPSATVMPVDGVASAIFTPGSAGTATITATSEGLTSASGSLTVTDLQLSIFDGDNQTGTVGAALNNPLVVQVVDNHTGLPEADVAVTFSDTAGDGVLFPQAAVTDSNGQASALFVLGATATAYSVIVTANDVGSVSFTAIGNSSDNTIAKVSGDNQIGNPGEPLSNPLVVEVRDINNNSLTGVTVTFNLLDGTGSTSPASVVTDSLGQASTLLTLGAETGVRTINAVAENIGGVTFTADRTNPIVLENQKTGDPDYALVRIQYTETDIVGYADATSVTAGDVLSLKVSMAQPGNYSIDVYRFGYYAGAGARLVTPSIGPLSGITQPDCQVTDPETRLVECQWSTSYSLAIGNDWISGLYMARLRHETTGKQFPIFFVVRDDSSTAGIVFQSSITTSLAYSNYGTPTERYSLYGFNSTGGQRALKVSFDRPSTELSEYSNLLRYEYNMIYWLESQGYDVSYVTNLDVHENPASLLQHKVFLSVGHDEYWSREMRDGVEAARDAGVNLGFFSANTAYWRVRFEASSSGQPNRVMACYKDPFVADLVEPTYLWRGPENNRPENALMGVMYTGDHGLLYGGFNFVVSESSDPYFNNTGLINNDALSSLVGYEWDAVVDNGFTPQGLVILSESPVTPSNVAPGLPPGTDTSIAHAVKYTASSGAKVFSTGSIQWAWGLDSVWVSPARDDARAKQFAVNVFADFGVTPATPDPGLILP